MKSSQQFTKNHYIEQMKNNLKILKKNGIFPPGINEIIVDNFAGGGGASIAMHKVNHPSTEHFCESVWDVDPIKVCKGRPVGLVWLSPDCKHFSRAKGGTLVSKEIRGLAWIALRWASLVMPRVIMLENVTEFKTWGPLVAKRDAKTGRIIRHINVSGKQVKVIADRGEIVPISE